MHLKYTYIDGRRATEFMVRNGIEARYVLQPDGTGMWYSRAGLALPQLCDATDGQEETGQGSEGDGRVQARHIEDRQTRPRQRRKGQKPQASDSDSAI